MWMVFQPIASGIGLTKENRRKADLLRSISFYGDRREWVIIGSPFAVLASWEAWAALESIL
jgi:hypothetical protein